jgi:polyhydroxyalkanoate synthesis regulator phasin
MTQCVITDDLEVKTMEEQTTQENNETELRSRFYEISRKILLAAFGAAAIAQDELEGFVNRLVERGEIAEKDARSLLKEIMERREKVSQERKANREREQRAAATKADIETLSARVAELTRQLEELKKQQSEGQA